MIPEIGGVGERVAAGEEKLEDLRRLKRIRKRHFSSFVIRIRVKQACESRIIQ